ncbi:oligosaccharide flippase family protein [Dyadobacter sp. LJ53]|uniref:oligosaccharide flippase family protein n=1 Tax=Dyadobacter chenwenxiniae TaxID=2906456 RepID=UPI001F23B5C9|nr:oligosaccharide flippase family protein [Dyadobacter chenwenxiniae]MCF0048440.1 oligosaccharide flippase family protein [Dyadobacter chenwenxiniae]
MENKMKAVNKVALNTGILYGRMLLTMGISLYSTRLVLNALGNTDFGIFNLIAGIIAMLSFLNSAMSISTQRFLSYYQGQNNIEKQKIVFTNSLILHLIIGLVVIIGLEMCGLFLFDGVLNIPVDRIQSATKIYHFMSLTVFFTIINVPFTGSLIAHENMLWVALVSILETLLKLGIAVLLLVINQDKLVVYGILTASVSIFSFLLYAFYCKKKYEECTFNNLFVIDKKLFKELSSFAGWNLFGSICGVTKDQGFAVLINVFLGATINAAYGIANQVSSQLTFFSATMLRALNPQIMKSEGAGDRHRMLRLSMMASKFGFFLLAFVAIPCVFEMEAILKFWLKTVPDYTETFCSLILISALVNQLTIGLQSAFQATGKVKIYQIVVGTIVLSNIPISYTLLHLKFPVYYPLFTFAIVELFACCFRIYLLNRVAELSIKEFFNRVIVKEIIPVLVISLSCFLVTHIIHNDLRFLFTIVISSLAFALSIFFTGLCNDEKEMITKIAAKIKDKIGGKKNLQTTIVHNN